MKKDSTHSRFDDLDAGKIYDVIVIGGGITGAFILWDSVLRGLDPILIEQNDYASGTSCATSKLIHGGLRYLKNAEFSLVRESLVERRILAYLTPHSIKPLGFIMPIYDFKNQLLMKAGLTLYDLLSFDRNKLLGDDSKIPSYKYLNKEKTILEDPNIPRDHLQGSVLYYDYANENPERHTCDFIFSAKKKGAKAFNYSKVKNIEYLNNIYSLTVIDKLSSKEFIIKTRTVVNSAGPWADTIDNLALHRNESNLIRSKGIHIITRNISQRYCSIRITKSKKHLFVIPWRGKTIIGTTDTVYNGSPDEFKVSGEDIQDLIEEINEYLNFKIEPRDVYYYYGGMRPLVDDSTDSLNTYNVSRKNEISNHKHSGRPGFITALGGKYTTSRMLAEKATDQVCETLGKGKICLTKSVKPDSGMYSDIPTLIRDLKNQNPWISEEKVFNLVTKYGSIAKEIISKRDKSQASNDSPIKID
ncbi:MAG: glycerol-3-phosphate dehydrogenase/oxidase, partial [Spirochaetia bacterium]|nr:glycerol-3-phosphate dehydrogenase/oxidase [Spirochaetia bacterium]